MYFPGEEPFSNMVLIDLGFGPNNLNAVSFVLRAKLYPVLVLLKPLLEPENER